MESTPYAVKKPVWVNIIFFAITTLGCVVGAPLYIYHYGISAPEWALFVFYMLATGLSITVGYHRLFAHASYKAHPVVQFLLLFFGAAAFEQRALMWASQHRDHHRFVDTDQDPYSIKKGFWYAHIGWILFWEHKENYGNAQDLQKNKMIMHQAKYYYLWSGFSGIVLPVLIGALTGHALGAFILSVCTRITLVYHSTFFINSICHMFGKSTYDIYSTAKDHWFIAFLTYGEGYHNFHHRFPSDYRNGVRWYQWDPSKWTIWLLSKVGLTWHITRVSDFKIIGARLAAENRRAADELKAAVALPNQTKTLEVLKAKYDGIRSGLTRWEHAANEYRDVLHKRVSGQSQEIKKGALEKLNAAREQYARLNDQWKTLIEMRPVDLQAMLLQLKTA